MKIKKLPCAETHSNRDAPILSTLSFVIVYDDPLSLSLRFVQVHLPTRTISALTRIVNMVLEHAWRAFVISWLVHRIMRDQSGEILTAHGRIPLRYRAETLDRGVKLFWIKNDYKLHGVICQYQQTRDSNTLQDYSFYAKICF